MGSKKKQPGKTITKGKAPKAKTVAPLPMVRTTFMASFTDRFIRNPSTGEQIFVAAADPDSEAGTGLVGALQDFASVVGVLADKNAGVNPVPIGSGTLRDQVIAFLITQNWPDGTSIPPEYIGRDLTVHLVEIAVLADRILQAINEGTGGGGTPTDWPSH